MKRLNAIILNNNYISRIGVIGGNLPELKTVILTNNKVSNLSEINNLTSTYLSNLVHLPIQFGQIRIRIWIRFIVRFQQWQIKP